ncbi:Calcium-binding endonuclease/exonuclease/phosphatase family [Euphorbia peplus]|nr:Calcium-binding endonuclease/exonuclease/phosphatase family [Euphorbia peplus]
MVAIVESNMNLGQLNSGGIETNFLNGAIPRTVNDESCISCTTFNILAPIYKRLDQHNQNIRESDFKAFWFTRNQAILDWLLFERSSIICLQEFWVGNEELVHMYQQRLGDAGYVTFQLGRTNNRGDGLLTAVHKDYFEVLNYQDLLFNDFGDRVAQLLHVRSTVPLLQHRKGDSQQEFLIVNTHLLFPHDSSLSIVRLHQVYKILQYVETYQNENKLNNMPAILCGDWNGSKRGHVYKFLRSQGFVSSYDNAHQYTDSDADAHKWVSHRNHRGNICGVDFIWLRNSTKSRKQLKTSWFEAIAGIIKCHLLKASLSEKDAFAFLKADEPGNFITYSAFCEGLRQVNLIGLPYGLSFQQTKDIWTQVDMDGNGIVDYEEFKERIWNLTCQEEDENCGSSEEEEEESVRKESIGFSVKDAFLYPREAENGMWPENYSLSDHARLTVVFSPVRLNSY